MSNLSSFDARELANAGAPATGIGNYVGPSGDVITVTDRDQASKLTMMGYTVAKGVDLQKAEVEKSFNHWYDKVAEGVTNFVGGMPGVTWAINSVLPADMAGNFNAAQQVGQEIDPTLSTASGLAGGLLSGALVGAAGTAAADAGGITALQKLTNFGEQFGTVAGSAYETNYLPGKMLAGGVENAMMGLGYKADAAALQHSLTPEGQDKIFDHIGYDTMLDFGIGAAIPAAATGLGKAFQAVGNKMEVWGRDNVMETIMGRDNMMKVMAEGRKTELGQFMDVNGLLTGNIPKLRSSVGQKFAEATEKMNEVKAAVGETKLPNQDQLGLHQILKNTVIEDEKLAKIVSKIGDTEKGVTFNQLFKIRKQVAGTISWSASDGQTQLRRMSAYKAINEAMDGIAAVHVSNTSGSTEMLNDWKTANHAYSNLSLISNNIDKGPKSTSWMEKTLTGMSYAAAGASALHATGALGLGSAVAVVKGAEKLNTFIKEGGVGQLSVGLSKVFKGTSQRLADAVDHGYYGLGPWSGATPANNDNFDIKAAQVRYSAGNPTQAMENTSKGLEKMGFPQPYVDPMLRRKMAIDQHLAMALPKSPFVGEVAPIQWSPSDDDKQKWLELYNTAHDVSHWIADPTRSKTAIAEVAYPDLVKRARQTVLDHVLNTQDMPMESRLWASQLLGMPVEPMLEPSTALVYLKAREAGKGQPVQVPPNKAATGKLDEDMISSDSTKLEQLQGK